MKSFQTENFKKYSKYYDALYEVKDYNKEVGFLLSAVKKYSPLKVKNILSLGCGTAGHDIILAKMGFNVFGIDRSKTMIAIARDKVKKENVKIDFKVADLTRFKTNKKFDFAMAMFNIVGYMAENESMKNFLKNTNKSLKKNAILVFDCWYGPAVLKDRPQNREKKFKDSGKELLRITTQIVDIEKSILDINFEIKEGNKSITRETHPMRFWYLKELEYFLKNNGFELVKTCNFMDFNSKISEDKWDIFVIARKG